MWHFNRILFRNFLGVMFAILGIISTINAETPTKTVLKMPSDVLFAIGEADRSPAEFKFRPEWAEEAKCVADKNLAVPFLKFVVGKNQNADWTPWHWSTAEAKAGYRRFTAEISFNSPSEKGKMFLVVGIAHGIPSLGSEVHVVTNGIASPVVRAKNPGMVRGPWDSFDVEGSSQLLTVEIPARVIRAGENTLTITLDKGSFIFYDYLCVREKPEALPAPPMEPMLDDFLAAGMPEEILFCTRKPAQEHWYATFGYYGDNACRFPFPMNTGGAFYIYNVKTKECRKIFEDTGGNVRDPQIHYDCEKFIFSYLPTGKKHYSLYEMNLDGTGLKQLTGAGEDTPLKLPEGLTPLETTEHRTSATDLNENRDFSPPGWDDYEPTYCPDDSIIFCSSRAKRWVNCWLTQVGTIYKCDGNGTNIRELSCNVEQDNTPWILPNGQIIYMRWEYVDRDQVSYHHLWTMNPDGTRQMIFYGNQRPGVCMLAPKPIPNSSKIVCVFSGWHGQAEHYGSVTVVDPRKGPDVKESAVKISKHTQHCDPWAFSEEHFLTASKNKLILLNGKGQEEVIYELPPELAKAGFWISEPRPVMKRERERLIADQTDPSKDYGTLALVNLYKGRKMKDLKPGTVKELLIYETLPKPIHYSGGMEQISTFGTFTIERLYGRVPVSEDGRAYFNLPACRPFLFVAIDEKGHCVKRMHSFTSVMPGESTVCIGCHEERTETPGADERERLSVIMRTPPVDPEPIAGVPDIFSFPRDIQPILDKHCVECHNPDREEGGFNCSGHWNPIYTFSYMQMSWRKMFGDNRNRQLSNFDPYEIGTGNSELLRLIEEGHEGVNMPEEEQRIIRFWLDAGANYAGTYAANASGGLGYYMQNRNVRNDKDWHETKAMEEAIIRRCDPCHCPTEKDKIGRYDLFTDYKVDHYPPHQDNMYVAHTMTEDNGRFNRHVIFDLSYPEQSKAVRGPLSKSAGGLGTCEAKSGKVVFADKNDPDYKTILACIERGRRYILEEDNRFSMITPSPNNGADCPQKFVPRWAYLREMIRYGLMPIDTDPNASYDPYELDRKYFESLWYKPVQK